MPISQRKLIRLAEAIRGQVRLLHHSRYKEVVRHTRNLLDDFDELRRQSDLLTICSARSWETASARVSERIAQSLRDLPYHASQVEHAVEACQLPIPNLRDVLADIQQTAEEFEDFHYDEKADELVVTTDPIKMEDVYLGPFEVRLYVPAISEMRRPSSVYHIVALEPHPAASNSSVTHPHVNNEHLCEGDAGAAIATALTNGRVCDFFQIVLAVLTTYNPDSPYVSLDDWHGTPCYDCGYIMGEDDTYWCHDCENNFCVRLVCSKSAA